MARTTPIDRTSYSARIATLREHISTANEELARQALAVVQHPEDANAAANVDDLRAEIKRHEESIQVLELAQQQAARNAGKADVESARRLHAERLAKLAVASAQAERKVLGILTQLEAIAPDLVALDEALRDRQQLAWAICTSAFGSETAINRFKTPLNLASLDSTVVSVLLQAVQASGLGRIGPTLQPRLSFDGMGSAPQSRDHIEATFRRQNERLASIVEVQAGAVHEQAVTAPETKGEIA